MTAERYPFVTIAYYYFIIAILSVFTCNLPDMSTIPLILVVEDDDDDRLLLETATRKSEFSCKLVFAQDGRDALQVLETMHDSKPDLILTDLNMPLMDGMELVKELKSSTQWTHIPVVMFTTTTTESAIKTAYNQGIDRFISKPPTFEGLQEVWQDLYQYWSQLPGRA